MGIQSKGIQAKWSKQLVRDCVGKKLFKSCLIRTEIKDTFHYSQ